MIAVDYATDCSMVWVLETQTGVTDMMELAAFLGSHPYTYACLFILGMFGRGFRPLNTVLLFLFLIGLFS